MPNYEITKDEFDELSPDLQGIYKSSGDNYIASGITDATGPKAAKKIKEEAAGYRTKGRETASALAALQSILGDSSAEELQSKLDTLEEHKLAAEGNQADFDDKLTKRVEARLAAATTPLQRQIEALAENEKSLAQRVQQYETKERNSLIQSEFFAVGKETGAVPGSYETSGGALSMIVSSVFEVVEGEVVTKDGVGLTPGLPPSVAVAEIKAKHPYLWQGSQGGGSGGGSGKGSAGVNPFAEKTFNLTQIGKMRKENPALAEKLELAAKNG